MPQSQFENALKKLDSFELNDRISAIDEIARDPGQDAARALLEAFEIAGWRDTKRYILSQLSRYLMFDRVFFALSPMLVKSNDAQLSSWVLNCLRSSKTNRYDAFLVRLFHSTESQIEKFRILTSLIHLTSAYVPGLIEEILKEHDLDLEVLKQDPLPAQARKDFFLLPSSFQILFNQFCGTYKYYDFKPLLATLSLHRDYYISDSAYINQLKLGGREDNRAQYELGLLEMESKDPVKEEFHQLFAENQFLQKATSLEKHLDYIFSLNSADVSNSSILTLKLFDQKKIEEYLSIYENEKNVEVMLRMFDLLPFSSEYVKKTARGLSERFASPKNCALVASFLWRRREGRTADIFEENYERIANHEQAHEFFRWLSLSHEATAIIPRLEDIFFKVSPAQQTDIINLLVMEHQLFLPQKQVTQSICGFLDSVFLQVVAKDLSQNKALLLRLYRAFGQMRYGSSEALKSFGKVFTDKSLAPEDRNGLIASLGSIQTPESHKIMLDLFESSTSLFLSPMSKRIIIRALSQSEFQIPDSVYKAFFSWADASNLSLILRFIHSKPSKISQSWLFDLGEKVPNLSYNEKKWFIKAVAQIPFEDAIPWLYEEAQGKEQTLKGLAVHTLLKIESDVAIKCLIEVTKRLMPDLASAPLIAKIFKDLRPPKQGHDQVLRAVESLLAQTTSETAYDAIFGYLSQLAVSRSSPVLEEAKSVMLDSKIKSALENRLAEEVSRFAKLSPVVRSVLLNAEIPAAHPEIFDEKVDKSTSILQYIKAIDIFLKERVGNPLSSDAIQAKMQGVVLAAGLDRYLQRGFSSQGLYSDTIGTEILADLDLTDHYGLAEFPFGKLKSVLEAIMSNKIFQEEFKVIDGLKAWGILLLLFGRTWGTKNRELLVKPKSDISIVSVSKRLIELQDYRNPIAHRHTVLELIPIEKIRKRTLTLLNDLQIMFD